MSVSNHIGHQSRTKVTSQVDGIARLPAKARADAKDEEEQAQRHQVPSANVVRIGQGEDAEHEDAAGDELGEEHAGPGHEGRRVRAEDAGGGGRPRHGPDPGAPFEGVKGRLVVAIDDGCAGHGPEELGQGVHGQLAPGVAAVQAVGQGHGRVEVTAGFAADIDA